MRPCGVPGRAGETTARHPVVCEYLWKFERHYSLYYFARLVFFGLFRIEILMTFSEFFKVSFWTFQSKEHDD